MNDDLPKKGISMKKLINTIIAFLALYACCGAEDSLFFTSRLLLSGYPWSVSKYGNFIFVPNRGTLSIVDITDPYNPVFMKNHDALTNPLAVYVVDTILYCRGGSSLVTINIVDPINPQNLSWTYLSNSTENPFGIKVINNKCYIACATDGIKIFDVSNPAVPIQIGAFNTPVSARDICVLDTIAYIADYESLQVINVSDPSNCIRISAVGMHWGCTGITLHDNYAYCATRGDWGTDGRIVSVDISNPANPIKLDSIYAIMGNPITAYYVNDRIYSIAADYFIKKGKDGNLDIGCKTKADIEGGIRVINVLKPDSVYYTCGYNTFNDPRGAIADSQYIYIADQDSGLIILRHNHYTGIEGKPYEVNLSKKMYVSFYPNPAKNNLIIKYAVPEQGNVSLKIYNMMGQVVKLLVGEYKCSGKYNVSWNGRNELNQNVSSGNYLCRYTLNGKNISKKIIVVR